MYDKVYDYDDLSEEERTSLKEEILLKGTDSFNLDNYNITKYCFDKLVGEIKHFGVYSFDDSYDEDEEEYWNNREGDDYENYDDDIEDDERIRQQWEEEDEDSLAEYMQNH